MIRLLLLAVVVMGFAFTMSGCNTVKGMGKDTNETWNWMSGQENIPDAYNQSARDF